MRKLVVSEFVSLDGVMEGPGGDDGYVRGPWTVPFWCEEIAAYKAEELYASDAQLLGRVTYEGFAAAWPGRTGDAFADHINASRKYVVSRTLSSADVTWEPTEILSGDLVEEVEARKAQEGRDILVAGSGTLVRALLAAGLVDELRLQVFPIVLGVGKRLFGEGDRLDVEVEHCSVTPTGVQLVTYRRIPPRAPGVFDYDVLRDMLPE